METKRLIVLMVVGMLLVVGWQPFVASLARTSSLGSAADSAVRSASRSVVVSISAGPPPATAPTTVDGASGEPSSASTVRSGSKRNPAASGFRVAVRSPARTVTDSRDRAIRSRSCDTASSRPRPPTSTPATVVPRGSDPEASTPVPT